MTLSIVIGLSNFHGDDRARAESMLTAIVAGGYCALVRDVVGDAVLEVAKTKNGAAVARWLDPADTTAVAVVADTKKLSLSMAYDSVPMLASISFQTLSLPTTRKGTFKLDLPSEPGLNGVNCTPVAGVGGWGRYKRAQKIYDVAHRHSLIVHAE